MYNRLEMRSWRSMGSQHVVFPIHGPLNWSRLEGTKWCSCFDPGQAWHKMAVSAECSPAASQNVLISLVMEELALGYRVPQGNNVKWGLPLRQSLLYRWHRIHHILKASRLFPWVGKMGLKMCTKLLEGFLFFSSLTIFLLVGFFSLPSDAGSTASSTVCYYTEHQH